MLSYTLNKSFTNLVINAIFSCYPENLISSFPYPGILILAIMRKLGFSSCFKQTIACLCLTVSRVQFMTNAVPKHPLWACTLVEKVISFMYVC